MSNANLTTGLAAAESAVEEMRQAGFVEVPTVFSQTSGGGRYILFPRTVAANVDMGDGSSALERIRLLERGLAANTTTSVVETIAERDLITGRIPGDKCYVIDATGDPGVEKGGAAYIWMPGRGDEASYWRKMTEEESQDVILHWENITGRPEQSAASLDKAALLAHAHDNKSVLDSLDRDERGRLTINGQPVDDGGRDTVTADSLGEDIPATLRDGGMLILIQEEE